MQIKRQGYTKKSTQFYHYVVTFHRKSEAHSLVRRPYFPRLYTSLQASLDTDNRPAWLRKALGAKA